MRDAALLLLGHGSTLNADSSAPTYRHAEEIRRRGIFAEVHVGFWKEEPNFRQALRQTSCRTVYVVPNFISSGYFTEQIIPRELGLTGPITKIGEQDVYYCQPVGLSPAMTEVLLKRAQEVVVASGETCDPKQTCLFICGHGTSMNDNSTKIIHEQAAIIRARGLYADCQAVLMEQQPFVKDWRTLTVCPNVIVVPFFISDGLHSYEDIPVLLGLTHNIREKGFSNPHREGERRLWYATAIGTETMIADVIVDLVQQSEEAATSTESGIVTDRLFKPLERFFAATPPPWKIGELVIRTETGRSDCPAFLLCHESDSGIAAENLRLLRSHTDLHDLVRLSKSGEFRPLRAAPNLEKGWRIGFTHPHFVLEALELIYPTEIANWALSKKGELPITPWRETAERQTGRFRIVRELGDDGVRELAAQVCDRGCLKRRLWSPCAQEVTPAPNEVPLLCPEACNYFVSKAREKLKGPEADAE